MLKPEILNSSIRTIWLALIVVLLDQAVKQWILYTFSNTNVIHVMPYLNFILTFNEGAAFSFLADMGGWQRWLLTGIALTIIIVLIIWLTKLPKRWTFETAGINLILGGAIGNTIDRILQGKVTDFIDFYIGSWHYATFNIADIAIFIGVCCLIIYEIWFKQSKVKDNV